MSQRGGRRSGNTALRMRPDVNSLVLRSHGHGAAKCAGEAVQSLERPVASRLPIVSALGHDAFTRPSIFTAGISLKAIAASYSFWNCIGLFGYKPHGQLGRDNPNAHTADTHTHTACNFFVGPTSRPQNKGARTRAWDAVSHRATSQTTGATGAGLARTPADTPDAACYSAAMSSTLGPAPSTTDAPAPTWTWLPCLHSRVQQEKKGGGALKPGWPGLPPWHHAGTRAHPHLLHHERPGHLDRDRQGFVTQSGVQVRRGKKPGRHGLQAR
jgi:hypothetical protein